jgi:hypothetical protein
MASTYSDILRIELIGTGDQAGTWGDTTNVNLGTLIEQAIASTTTVSLTAGNVTLTDLDGASDQARCAALRFTGSPAGTTNVIVPATVLNPARATYVVANGTAQSVVVKTGTSISAGSFVVGCEYRILTPGTTNFVALGAADNNPGTVFTANAVGSGTGTAEPAGVTVPAGEVYLIYFDTTFFNFRLVGRSATSANTPNTLVLRDASGNFTAGTITATTLNATNVNATTVSGGLNGNLVSGITAATPATGDDTPKVATTAFVQNSIDPLVGPISGGSSGLVTVSGNYDTVSISLASPAIVTLSSTVTTQSSVLNASTTATLVAPNSSIKVGQRVTGTNITNSPNPTFVSAVGTATITAGSFVVGVQYTIISLGTTDWNVVAGTTGQTYTIGQVVTAAAAGSGTGTAYAYTITLSQAATGSGTTTLTFSNMPNIGDRVVFKTTGTLPTGLSANTPYFVINATGATTFSVSLTAGGAGINTTTAGSGTHSFSKVSSSGSIELSGALGAGFGGTGTNSLKPNNLIVGNGTSTVQVIPAGAADNILTSVTTSTVNAGSFVVGTEYTIATPGTTTWTSIGAANNNAGTVFTATGAGSGTGVATTNVWQSSSNNKLTLGTQQTASGSETSLPFTSIPSWVKRIMVSISNLSTNGTDMILVRLGVSGSAVTSGYTAVGVRIDTDPDRAQFTAGFPLTQTVAASNAYYGIYTITKLTGNTWVASFTGVDYGNTFGAVAGGSIALGGTLDSLFIQTSGGVNTFDSGTVNIMYE